jgi:hypothetical protein
VVVVVGSFSLGPQNRAVAAKFAMTLTTSWFKDSEGKSRACVSCSRVMGRVEVIGSRRLCNKAGRPPETIGA